ncbi:hypothetical protein B0H19DRAFT_1385026 [Mycena capillaripes]|nr:hypothetical protein B0H19DRAFT_1385026 [Mycena capillaripes]
MACIKRRGRLHIPSFNFTFQILAVPACFPALPGGFRAFRFGVLEEAAEGEREKEGVVFEFTRPPTALEARALSSRYGHSPQSSVDSRASHSGDTSPTSSGSVYLAQVQRTHGVVRRKCVKVAQPPNAAVFTVFTHRNSSVGCESHTFIAPSPAKVAVQPLSVARRGVPFPCVPGSSSVPPSPSATHSSSFTSASTFMIPSPPSISPASPPPSSPPCSHSPSSPSPPSPHQAVIEAEDGLNASDDDFYAARAVSTSKSGCGGASDGSASTLSAVALHALRESGVIPALIPSDPVIGAAVAASNSHSRPGSRSESGFVHPTSAPAFTSTSAMTPPMHASHLRNSHFPPVSRSHSYSRSTSGTRGSTFSVGLADAEEEGNLSCRGHGSTGLDSSSSFSFNADPLPLQFAFAPRLFLIPSSWPPMPTIHDRLHLVPHHFASGFCVPLPRRFCVSSLVPNFSRPISLAFLSTPSTCPPPRAPLPVAAELDVCSFSGDVANTHGSRCGRESADDFATFAADYAAYAPPTPNSRYGSITFERDRRGRERGWRRGVGWMGPRKAEAEDEEHGIYELSPPVAPAPSPSLCPSSIEDGEISVSASRHDGGSGSGGRGARVCLSSLRHPQSYLSYAPSKHGQHDALNRPYEAHHHQRRKGGAPGRKPEPALRSRWSASMPSSVQSTSHSTSKHARPLREFRPSPGPCPATTKTGPFVFPFTRTLRTLASPTPSQSKPRPRPMGSVMVLASPPMQKARTHTFNDYDGGEGG